MFIQLEDATVTFKGVEPIHALKAVSFSVNEGEWINILGPSGSGKTTLLNVIGGMLQLSSGSIVVDGKNLSQLKNDDLQSYRRTIIGYIFQDYRLFDQYTVLENVMLPQWPYQPRKVIEEKAKTILQQLQMGHRLQALPADLSGGEKQRTAIARAMLHEPKLLLCDEPTGNLDEENRENILNVLSELNKNGVTILLVTHDTEVAKRGTKQLFIRDGKLQK
ncbi:ABC transporter ATP-binding protein [Bacillus kwashiorkori]|uniref:ABC transporter ATP-binding protein n=1 Tax=Bacillus kwashiorkori TaxID=1522318 RepID=UPI000780A946|nr:ABC transporter ATP-binding protein [Bacillus kwashiorkori]